MEATSHRRLLAGCSALLLCGLLSLGCDEPPSPDAGPSDGGVDGGSDAGPPPPARAASEPLIEHVDPFLGTGGLGFNDIGSAFPGPQRPFGMVRPGPDTSPEGAPAGFLHCSGFAASDDYITGFSHARMHGTGIADYGNLALMPVPAMEPGFVAQEASRSLITEGSSEASPGYYAVTLERGDIRVELSARDRVAMHRYTFAAGAPQAVLVDAGHRLAHDVEVVDGSVAIDVEAREVSGYAQVSGGYSGRFGGVRLYFVARFDRAFTEHGVWDEDASMRDGGVAGERGAWVAFDPSGGDVVHAEVALSYVDVEGARANLDAESAGYDFDAVRAESEAVWEAWLSRVRVEGRSDTDFRRFYTALYHVLLMPTLGSDVDGRYRGVDGEVHTADGYDYFTDFSLWDTFRTLHPLLTLLYPDVQTDMLRSLTAMAADGGAMPRWPLGHGYTGGMLGEPAAIVMADSWLKGLRDFDLRAAYDAMRRGAFGEASEEFAGRGYTEEYERLGYVPVESGSWSASRTLEFAYGDDALATLADALDETEDAALFRERAGRWRNIWDPEREFFVGRQEDGSFTDSFDERGWQGYYSEGNAWQFLWYVPHDLPGLAEQVGGREVLLERLTGFFERSRAERRGLLAPEHYWHGNEPDLHASFVFAALGDPEPTARWSRWVSQTMYGDGPTGLPGNDDGGTLSAWLVFASLGLYTIAGEDHYLIGSPLMTRAELTIGDGTFVIDAAEASDAHPVVDSSTVDGSALEGHRLPHAAITAGGQLVHSMR